MKNIFIATAIAAVALTACKNDSKPTTANTNNMTEHSSMTEHGGMMDSGMNSMNSNHAMGADHSNMMKNASMNTVMNAYLKLKNSLANDDATAAATAGNEVATAIANVDVSGFTTTQKNMFDEVKADIKEHGEHIGSNGDKIAHQREHFETMSKDMYDMVKTFGTNQTMYYTNCPMYNKNKGANWLSEVKEIRNPYLGKKMHDCGTVKEEIK